MKIYVASTDMRRLTQREMRIVLGIEFDLNDRRGLKLRTLDARLRREIRQTWKRIVADPPESFYSTYSRVMGSG